MSFRLRQLPYDDSALEPHFDAEWIAGQRRRQEVYARQLEELLAGTEWADVHVEALLLRLHELPEELRGPVAENAGGHLNHALLFAGIGPDGGGEPGYELLDDIERDFGSFPGLQEAVTSASASLAGEGWVWLVWNGRALELVPTDPQAKVRSRERWDNRVNYLLRFRKAGRPVRPGGTTLCWMLPLPRSHPESLWDATPEPVIRDVLALSARRGPVLDPFAGAGTVGRVAAGLGREWIGVERDPAMAALTARRLRLRPVRTSRRPAPGSDAASAAAASWPWLSCRVARVHRNAPVSTSSISGVAPGPSIATAVAGYR